MTHTNSQSPESIFRVNVRVKKHKTQGQMLADFSEAVIAKRQAESLALPRLVDGLEQDPRIASMAEILLDVLSDARSGDVDGIAIMSVRKGSVRTQWSIRSADGHGHLLISAASRLVHDLNDASNVRPIEAAEDDGA